MTKIKHLLKPIHLQAIVFLVLYNLISKTVFFKSLSSNNLLINFFGPYVFGVVAGIVFLYLLSHEDFFHFMKDVEKIEKKKEKSLLKKYIHHGKILATLIITTLGGPIFGAITIRLILPKYKHNLILLAIGSIFSTLLTVGIAKGLIVGLF